MKSHCPHGHEYTPENTYYPPRGSYVCRACNRAKTRTHMRSRGPGQRRAHYLKKYGWTPEDFDVRLLMQCNRCACCDRDFSSPRDMHIDHDHDTMQVRGILCQKCNMGIGLLGDDLVSVQRAVRYLEGK